MNATCVLNRLYNEEIDFLAMDQVTSFKRKASNYDNDLLFHCINSELVTSIDVANTYDRRDKLLLKDRSEFIAAYDNFTRVLNSISDVGFRSSVALPTNYRQSIKENWFLNYQISNKPGRTRDDRKARFYLGLLALYQMFSGKKPASSVGGPTWKFICEIVQVLQGYLVEADRSSETFRNVNVLWRAPGDQAFSSWFGEMGGKDAIQPKVDHYVASFIADFEQFCCRAKIEGRSTVR